jgi:hypothetical protein
MLVGWMPLRRMRLTTDSGARWMKRGIAIDSLVASRGSIAIYDIPD